MPQRTQEQARSTLPTPAAWSRFVSESAPPVDSPEEIFALSTPDYLAHINGLAQGVLASPDYLDPETGYISDSAWKRLVDGGVLAPYLLDRDSHARTAEIMGVSRILSYHNTELGLAVGIVGSLGVIPTQMFGSAEQQEYILGLVRSGERIGLGITETHSSGTRALNMTSQFRIEGEEGEEEVVLSCDKHLQGNSGYGGLITFANEEGGRKKGLIFVPQEHFQSTHIATEGLHSIQYSRNEGEEIRLSAREHLLARFDMNELTRFQCIFNESRLGFVSLVLGQHERAEAEAYAYSREWKIGIQYQIELPAVQELLRSISAHRLISEAIFARSVQADGFGENTSTEPLAMQAAIVKALSTEYALEAAEKRAVLRGGKAYYEGDALHEYVNTWPFSIFEGAEPFLYSEEIGGAALRRGTSSDGAKYQSFAKSPANTDFFDFFLNHIAQQPMFSVSPLGALQGLREELTDESLRRIDSDGKSLSGNLNETMGRIIARLFALGALDDHTALDERDSDFEYAARLVNFEIRELVEKFLFQRSNPVS